VSAQSSLLVLSMYVLGYGTGPLFFSPLSEIPVLGRSFPYVVSYSLFLILSIPAALVNNYPGLVVLRFLQGFFGGPVLATGGASAADMFSFPKLPYAMSIWVFAAYGGPALGPLLSVYAVKNLSWHWVMYEILIIGGVTGVLLVCFLPETNPETILLERAKRLRKVTGRSDLLSASEQKPTELKLLPLLGRYLWTPFEVPLKDPAILFTDVYTALVYGIYVRGYVLQVYKG
jgi:DHA1 family multidrug resistance protein-like MFS transporter